MDTKIMKNKITIVGAGMVGATVAHSVVMKNIAEEVALIDINEKLATAQAMDLQHAVPFAGQIEVKVGSYEDCRDSAVAVITCGVAQKPGETRLELLNKNAKIVSGVAEEIFANNPDIVLVVVTNPVDVLTRILLEKYPEKKQQIFGTGTLLDSARFRHLLGKKLDINPKSIHAYILGEHGDSEFPLWSNASVGNMKLGVCQEISDQEKTEIFEQVKNAAYKIIAGKKSTYYAIGAGTAYLLEVILRNKKTVLPVSYLVDEKYGLPAVSLSMPAIIGRRGILGKICLDLSEEEKLNLQHSAEVLEEAYQGLSII